MTLDKVTNYIACALTLPFEVDEGNQNDPKPNLFRKINALADLALTPLRYFSDDKPKITFCYSIQDPTKVYEIFHQDSTTEKNWKKTLLMIAMFIPGLILGVIAKAIALCSSVVRGDLKIASEYLQILTENKISNETLAPKHRALDKDCTAFCNYLKSHSEKGAAIWDQEETIKSFDALFKNAASFMCELFSELERCGKKDPLQMAKLLSWQPQEKNDPIFCWCYFRSSLWAVYEFARNRRYPSTYTNQWKETVSCWTMQDLTSETVEPFYKEGTPQNSWRKLYNELASKLGVKYPSSEANKEPKSMRDYLHQNNDGTDRRCSVTLDYGPLPKFMQFIPLPGCPTLRLPEILK